MRGTEKKKKIKTKAPPPKNKQNKQTKQNKNKRQNRKKT